MVVECDMTIEVEDIEVEDFEVEDFVEFEWLFNVNDEVKATYAEATCAETPPT